MIIKLTEYDSKLPCLVNTRYIIKVKPTRYYNNTYTIITLLNTEGDFAVKETVEQIDNLINNGY